MLPMIAILSPTILDLLIVYLSSIQNEGMSVIRHLHQILSAML